MQIKIYDYTDAVKTVNVPDCSHTGFLLEVSGDQILCVRLKDGSTKFYDSCPYGRNTDFYDGGQFIRLYDGLDCRKYKDEE